MSGRPRKRRSDESQKADVSALRNTSRKRVSRSKRVKRPKIRGQYVPKSSKHDPCPVSEKSNNSSDNEVGGNVPEPSGVPTTFEDDADLAECVFSDDEERADYLESMESSCRHAGCHTTCVEDQSDEESRSSTVSMVSSILSPLYTTAADFELGLSSANTLTPTSLVSSRSALGFSSISPQPSTSSARPGAFTFPEPQEKDVEEPVVAVSTTSVSHIPEVDISDEHSDYFPLSSVIETGLATFRGILPKDWIPIADQTGFHLLLLSPGTIKSVQREVVISYLGVVSVRVHCVPLPFTSTLLSSIDLPSVKFEENSVEDFCKRAHKIVQELMQYKICVGGNHMESQNVWSELSDTYIDVNPFQEESYVQCCRSLSCSRLVEHGRRLRCDSCNKVMNSLKNRAESLISETWSLFTPNSFLSSQQKLEKIQLQSEELKRRANKIYYYKKKIVQLIDTEGVDVDENLNEDLYECLANAKNLTETAKWFMEEQLKCASKSDPRGHRWHPSMIRLALQIRMKSPAAYEALRDSGVIKLPSQKTLYDYSHALDPKAGVNSRLLNIVKKKVDDMKESHQKYVALLVDEMYISKNLVYKQSDGTLVGYVHLSNVEEEMARVENFLKNVEAEFQPQLASKMLAFVVKGLTSNLKYVVASYPCNQLTKDMLYFRAWEVISRLERVCVKVLGIVCDGSSVNRAFIAMHTPITITKSGVVFDTINFCSLDRRPLFFMSDVAHLMKTIRNCFYNSGEGEKKVRCLQLNGQKIQWKTIVRLYLSYKSCNFRRSFKLNSKNVFPNSYSCMNVKDAVHVLSETVATDIELQKWSDTEETVDFIRRWNKFFDCMNGLHVNEHIRKRNPNLAPYKEVTDPRFKWLESCIDYLHDWKQQVEKQTLLSKDRDRMQLSQQTQQGIEVSVRGFTGAVKFLLNAGAGYVMGRAFSQDHLENYVSKQRARGGGSNNPNADQYLHSAASMGIRHDLGIRSRGANAEQGPPGMKITHEPLPKRKPTKSTRKT